MRRLARGKSLRHVAGRPFPVFALQAGTMPDPGAGANTSFADFPAWPALPPPTVPAPPAAKRGHRWSSPTASSSCPSRPSSWWSTGAKVSRLIPLYAIACHQLTLSQRVCQAPHHAAGAGLKRGLFINGTAPGCPLVVDIIICITKFTEAAG